MIMYFNFKFAHFLVNHRLFHSPFSASKLNPFGFHYISYCSLNIRFINIRTPFSSTTGILIYIICFRQICLIQFQRSQRFLERHKKNRMPFFGCLFCAAITNLFLIIVTVVDKNITVACFSRISCPIKINPFNEFLFIGRILFCYPR